MSSFQRVQSDLSNEKIHVPVMRRIQSDISATEVNLPPPQQQQQNVVYPGQYPQHQQQPPPANVFPQQQQQMPPVAPTSQISTAGAPSAVSNPRDRSVHQLLGGGKFADVVLWRKKRKSICLLGTSTVVWFMFECSGYTLISLVANVLLFLLVALFAWANLAALVNRPLPPVLELQLTDEKVNKVARRVAVEINGALHYCRNLSTGKDFPLLLKACITLWLLSTVGQWFTLLTLIYLGIIGTLTLPLAYEKHDKEVNKFMEKVTNKVMNQYHKLDECCLSKFPQLCCK